jgi:hypothetical protein
MARIFQCSICWTALTFFLATSAAAHDIITTNLTFTRDVSRILARHCTVCHDEKSSIPLVTYEQVRPWAVGIKEQVLSRRMPPWGAVKGFGDLAPDYALGQEEIMILAAWVIGGAPQGDPKLLPGLKAKVQTTSNVPLEVGLGVQTRAVLKRDLSVAAVSPITDVVIDSARLIAKLPDGRIEPLVWLYRFDPKYSHSFTFRRPLTLPHGTIVESSAPLKFALETNKKTLRPIS